MLKVSFKQIKDFSANDVTMGRVDFIKRDNIHRVAMAIGREGCKALLFESDGVYYKILGRSHNLFYFL